MEKQIFGLLGKNIAYSFSRNYFNQKFERDNINAQYVNFDVTNISQLSDVLKTKNLRGLNVTIPYKQAVIPFLDDLSNDAKTIGAVNTIEVADGKHIGHNTDHIGFRDSIKPLLKPHHQKALILGTGGASKAVAFALDSLGIGYKFVSRQKVNDTLLYRQLDPEILSEHTVIINCTPIGTSPEIDRAPEIPFQHLGKSHLLYDLIYNPGKTRFLQRGETAGATIINGYEMLVGQAEASWKIWNNL
ncbi:MAG: shikimate dehydrogenase [Flavobacterium sp.]|nr:shikimate dehydrogenase [Flavobacterium sp.]